MVLQMCQYFAISIQFKLSGDQEFLYTMFWNFSLDCWTDLLLDISISKATSKEKKQQKKQKKPHKKTAEGLICCFIVIFYSSWLRHFNVKHVTHEAKKEQF